MKLITGATGYCTHAAKFRYASEESATEALAVVIAHRKATFWGGPYEKRVYQCPWCWEWHLTHKSEESA